ncbi:MAG: hypothetical protein PVH27_14620, partial [Desulfobacterales bacterium]
MDVPKIKDASWRDYQAKLQRERRYKDRKKFMRRKVKFVLPVLVVCLAIYGFISGSFGSLFDDGKKAQDPKPGKQQVASKKAAP